jgi:putative addiction module CopG family antidote
MDVRLTPDQEAFIRRAIATGRHGSAEDAVREAMDRWEEAERVRIETLAAIDQADAEADTGLHSDWTDETLPRLADELKRDARLLRDSKRPG